MQKKTLKKEYRTKKHETYKSKNKTVGINTITITLNVNKLNNPIPMLQS